MTCDGRPLMDMVRRQQNDEAESLKTWKLPVQIVSPLLAAGVLILIVYAIRQRVQYLRMLDRDDWRIDFFVPKNRCSTQSAADVGDSYGLASLENDVGQWDIHEVVTRPLSIVSVFDVNRKVQRHRDSQKLAANVVVVVPIGCRPTTLH